MENEPELDLKVLSTLIEPFIHSGRSGLLPALQAAQHSYGCLPKNVTQHIAEAFHIPLADVNGVIEFYSLFHKEAIGKKNYQVCTDPACALRGADAIFDRLVGNLEANSNTSIEKSPCLGLCEHAPAITLNGDFVKSPENHPEVFIPTFPDSKVFGSRRHLSKNCGRGFPTTLKDYGEYLAFKQALKMAQDDVIAEIKASGLVGRGGAAFPTGIKWEGARKAEGFPKYIVCNADESEPGTFKDRVLLSDDPHLVIEGMCIAAYAVGATQGFIYLRGEYQYIAKTIENAIKEARFAGYLGDNFDITLRIGAGAYICGEETALFESIEGKRGFPRVKPPFPTTQGLFGKPTVINNVETLCNIPLIIHNGVSQYRQLGTEKSPGTKLFCLSGDIKNPGVYEVPFGTTLRDLLEMADGSGINERLQAILIGGAAGAFAIPSQLDVGLTIEDLRAAGLPLGSGVIMAVDKTRDLRDILKRLGEFFAHESCGKCYPCQIGTQRQMEILDRIANRRSLPGDIERLQDVGWTMTDASLCGLGQTAASATLSAIKLFPNLFMPSSL